MGILITDSVDRFVVMPDHRLLPFWKLLSQESCDHGQKTTDPHEVYVGLVLVLHRNSDLSLRERRIKAELVYDDFSLENRDV